MSSSNPRRQNADHDRQRLCGASSGEGCLCRLACSLPCRRQLADAPVISGLKMATPPTGTPSSYAATMSSGMGAKSATRRKSRNDVPVEALSVLGAPRLLTTSSMLMVRKSMLQRTVFVVFGTVE